jgi:hypothetical protein
MLRRLALLIAMLNCGAAAWAADEPKWLQDARVREGKLAKPREIKSKDGWLRASVPGKLVGDIEVEEGAYTITFDIGAETPIRCEVIVGSYDQASLLRTVANQAFEDLEPVQGKIEAKELEYTDAGAFGVNPYLQAHWIYVANDGKQSAVGMLKQLTTEKLGHGIYCAHLEIGYTKTFHDAARAFTESLVAPPDEKQAAPYFTEISVASLGGIRVGYAVTTLTRDAEGDSKTEVESALIMPSPGGGMESEDSFQIEWIQADGSLINAQQVEVENGELATNVSLNFNETQWVVDGEVQGKKVTLKLPEGVNPGSVIGQAMELRGILAGEKPEGKELNMPLWLTIDPGKLTDTKTTVLSKKNDNEYTATSRAGPLEFRMSLDKATGLPLTADFDVGAQSMRIERIYVNGSP